MKEVSWHVAKVYPRDACMPDGKRIDIWDSMDTQAEAQAYVKADGPDTPFVVVKMTVETQARRRR